METATLRGMPGRAMRVLVIEDEVKTASYLHKGLTEHGLVVDLETDGNKGLHLALEFPYDLLIVDVMLPGRDGWSIVSDLRKRDRQTPVLFLTARDSVADRVRGLDLGADDYLVKPFAFSELLARVRSILRRGSAQRPTLIRIADLELDLQRHKAFRADSLLDLTPKEFLLLSFLARKEGEILSRTLIAEHVWDMNFDSDTNVIDVHIRRLRSKVDEPYERKLIHTVRGMGYVLESR